MLISAGLKFITSLCAGKFNPMEFILALILSFASLTVLSGSPTILNATIPEDSFTSTFISTTSVPKKANVFIFATT